MGGFGISLQAIVPISYFQECGRYKRTFGVLLGKTLELFNGFWKLFFPKIRPSDPVPGFPGIGAQWVRSQEYFKLTDRPIKSVLSISHPPKEIDRRFFIHIP